MKFFYREICDKYCVKRLYQNHPKLQTHINILLLFLFVLLIYVKVITYKSKNINIIIPP